MRLRAICSVLAFAGTLTAAQASQNGKATASGACSVAHSGNGDTIVIKNCGIGQQQGDKIITLLKEVLVGQGSDTINAKLDELLKVAREGRTRRLSPDQIKGLETFLSNNSSANFFGITYNSSDRDSTIYANDFKTVFAGKHWPSDGGVTMGTSAPVFGVFVDINPADKDSPAPQAISMVKLLSSLGIPCQGRLFGPIPQGYYEIEIGLKPVNP